MDQAVGAVVRAWIDEGTHPDYHQAAQAKLMAEWPTLYRALVALAVARSGKAE
jgi:hypothetical protein